MVDGAGCHAVVSVETAGSCDVSVEETGDGVAVALQAETSVGVNSLGRGLPRWKVTVAGDLRR